MTTIDPTVSNRDFKVVAPQNASGVRAKCGATIGGLCAYKSWSNSSRGGRRLRYAYASLRVTLVIESPARSCFATSNPLTTLPNTA